MTKQQIDAALVEQAAQEIAGAFSVPAAHWPLMEHKHREQYRAAAKIGLQRGLSLQQTGKPAGISPAQAVITDARAMQKIVKELLDELWEDRHTYSSSEEPFKQEFSEAVAFCSWKSRHE